ncbi:MAG TPA: PAS domain-containing protein, partial [Gemmatimonadaceae bacterium]|nr:PAS domain-containing protein [Gemmatimonadaceae bacterium]
MTFAKPMVDFADVVAAIVDSDYAVFELSANGTVSSWTPSAARVYGFSVKEMLGRLPRELVPIEFEQTERRWLELALTEGRAFRVETERLGKDGTRRRVSHNLIPLRDDLGIIIGAGVIECELSREPASTQPGPATPNRVEPRTDALGPFRARYRTPTGRNETVLVVDDESPVRRL